jgi:6,7-dimethyl-8-ribityllumazine synthase
MNRNNPGRRLPTPRRARAPLARIAFVQSCWHRDIVDQSLAGFLGKLGQVGLEREHVECFEVPGAFEIPLHVKLLARSGRYAAVVAAGFVVDGGIYRHEFVASSVIDALMRVQLDTEVPVISVVLTPQRFHEHEEHRSFFRKHFVAKGEEAALACAAAIFGVGKLRLLAAEPENYASSSSSSSSRSSSASSASSSSG